jgi:hypothetical protein
LKGAPAAVIDLSPEEQLDGFINKYSPEIAASARDILATMRKRLPGAVQMVYDNYNALVIGFVPMNVSPTQSSPSFSTHSG